MTMNESLRCPSCAAPLIAGHCLACDARGLAGFIHRELILLAVLVGVTVAAFFLTREVAHGNGGLRRRQAAAWFAAAHDGSGAPAITALRRAVARDPANPHYRLELADALTVSRQDAEARRVLLALRDEDPENAVTNTQLARLAARSADAEAARRYYEDALDGLWRPEQAEERSAVRVELIEFFLARRERERALSQLLVLAATLPEEANALAHVGALFLAAGDPARALVHYARAIGVDRHTAGALAGAGESAFELGDYRRALQYLTAAPETARVAELRDLTRLIVSSDPLAPRLGTGERTRRLESALEQATRRLDACRGARAREPTVNAAVLLADARAFESRLATSRGAQRRELIDDGLELVSRIELITQRGCEVPAAPLDRALVLIGRRHGFDQP